MAKYVVNRSFLKTNCIEITGTNGILHEEAIFKRYKKMLLLHEQTGRPLGSNGFLTRLEKSIGRLLKPNRPGRKPKKCKKYVRCPLIYRQYNLWGRDYLRSIEYPTLLNSGNQTVRSLSNTTSLTST